MIVFLDFDGVLHPEPCYPDQFFCKRDLFEDVMRAYQSVEIVITSTWKKKHSLQALRSHFSLEIAKRIVDTTPDLRQTPELHELAESIGPTYTRQVEIEGWLRKHDRVWESWVALDDRAYWFRPFEKNLLLCDAKTGMDEDLATALRNRLATG
jgi:HAD domain in Swiss Army Knife RNA repair proteins